MFCGGVSCTYSAKGSYSAGAYIHLLKMPKSCMHSCYSLDVTGKRVSVKAGLWNGPWTGLCIWVQFHHIHSAPLVSGLRFNYQTMPLAL